MGDDKVLVRVLCDDARSECILPPIRAYSAIFCSSCETVKVLDVEHLPFVHEGFLYEEYVDLSFGHGLKQRLKG